MPLPRVVNVAQRAAPAADGLTTYTLQPMPLSALLIWVSGSINAANATSNLDNLLSLLDDLNLTVGGTTIWQGSLVDLVAYQGMILRTAPRYIAPGQADNDLAQIHCVLPLARRIGDPLHCLPPTPAGQLRLTVTEDIAAGNLDTLRYSIDAVHIDEADPLSFLRCQTMTRTAPATGPDRIDLPVGRILDAVGLFQTTERVTEAGARGINRIKMLRDGVDIGYPSIESETAQALMHALGVPADVAWDHRHEENTAAMYAQNALTRSQQFQRGTSFNHLFLDLDPMGDYTQGLDLTTCNRAQLELDMGTAELYRVLPVERWTRETTQLPMLAG